MAKDVFKCGKYLNLSYLLCNWWIERKHLKRCPCSDPECAAELCVGQLRGQFEVLKADSLSGSLVPGEQYGQLERRHLQVVLPHLVFKGDLRGEGGAAKVEAEKLRRAESVHLTCILKVTINSIIFPFCQKLSSEGALCFKGAPSRAMFSLSSKVSAA